MSRLRANQITNQSADGAPTVQNGLIVSGISSVGTGVTLSSIGDATYSGIITANSFSGSATGLTNVPAANITGSLPAISGANLTGIITAGNLPAIYSVTPTTYTGSSGASFTISGDRFKNLS